MTKKSKRPDIYVGDDAFQKACHFARYSHKHQLVWRGKDGRFYTANATDKTCKMAMLATGTQGKFWRVSPTEVKWQIENWRMAVHLWDNLRRHHTWP